MNVDASVEPQFLLSSVSQFCSRFPFQTDFFLDPIHEPDIDEVHAYWNTTHCNALL
jgi:hypothetical protein